MEWILLSMRTVGCIGQTPSSADGSSSTPLTAPQSFPLLELRLHSSHEVLVAIMMGSPCSSQCVSSLLLSVGNAPER
jgi:hypothetical protein